MTATPFSLTPDDYWKDPWKNAVQLDEQYVFQKVWGLHIDAPPTVNTQARKSIPVPFLYVAQLREAYKVDLDTMTKVVASRLEDRAFFIGDALPPREGSDEPPIGKDSTDLTCSKYTLDVEKRLRLLKKPGTYRIALLLQQQMSNVVPTKIEPSPPAPADRTFPNPPSRELLKSFDRPPAIPAEPGIALAVDRVVLDSAGATALLRGSFRLPLLDRERVPRSLPRFFPARSLPPDYGTPRPSAILPIAIVILASGSAAEFVIRLRVPTFDELVPNDGTPIATGAFAIDLFAIRGVRGYARTYSIYAFCGEFSAGPSLMATVTKDMLPVRNT